MANDSSLEFSESINQKIYKIRGQQVMLDRDLAALYGVSTGRLNEQVKRNQKRFPKEFMFQLTKDELEIWMSQNAISKSQQKGLRKLPSVFTEYGVAMLSSVLKSDRATQINIRIIQTFINLRKIAGNYAEILEKITVLEEKYDAKFRVVFQAIQHMFELEEKDKAKKIGFLK